MRAREEGTKSVVRRSVATSFAAALAIAAFASVSTVVTHAAVAAPAVARQDDAPAEGPKNAKAQMKAAYAVKKQSHKKEGDEKQRILLAAVEEYRKVLSMFPDDREQGALATFRIGEIHRTLRDTEAATRAFQAVLTFDEQHKTVARAFLELGHLARRDKRIDAAVQLYEQVVRQCPEVRDQGARALTWIAKCKLTQKFFDEARQPLRTIIDDYTDETKTALSAYDLLAKTYIDEGNLKMAAEILGQCRERYERLEASGDKAYLGIGDRIAKLKSWKKLEEARREASGDDEADESEDDSTEGGGAGTR